LNLTDWTNSGFGLAVKSVIYPPVNATQVYEEKLDKTLELTTSILAMRDLDTLLKKIADTITDDFGFEQCDVRTPSLFA
jgi:hypothetical protein